MSTLELVDIYKLKLQVIHYPIKILMLLKNIMKIGIDLKYGILTQNVVSQLKELTLWQIVLMKKGLLCLTLE